MDNIIYLEKFLPENSKVLVGRDNGIHARIISELDLLDQSDETVTIVVTKNIFSLNHSFMEAMFGKSVQTLGTYKFLMKYQFENFSSFHISTVLDEVIDRANRRLTNY